MENDTIESQERYFPVLCPNDLLNSNIQSLELRIEQLLKTCNLKWKPTNNVPQSSAKLASVVLPSDIDTSGFYRATEKEISRRKRESEYLRERCVRLEDQLHHNMRHYDALADEQLTLKSDFQSLYNGIQFLAAQQRNAKRDMELYINGLIDRVHPGPLLVSKSTETMEKPHRISGTSNESGYFDSAVEYDTHAKKTADSLKLGTPTEKFSPALPRSPKTSNEIKQLQQISNKYEPAAVQSISDPSCMVESALSFIFGHLDSIELLVCGMVCRSWNKIAGKSIFWKRITITNKSLEIKVLVAISKRCSDAKAITLTNLKACDVETEPSQSKKKGSLEIGFLTILRETKSLRFCRIDNCDPALTDRAIWLLSHYAKDLKHFVYMSSNFPLGASVICALGFGCRKILSLALPSSNSDDLRENKLKFDDGGCQMIARCWKNNLQSLSIGGSYFTVKGLLSIVKSCPQLQYLELQRSFPVNNEHARMLRRNGLALLETLSFIHIPISAEAIQIFLEKCHQLKTLTVASCSSDYSSNQAYRATIEGIQVLLDSNAEFRSKVQLRSLRQSEEREQLSYGGNNEKNIV